MQYGFARFKYVMFEQFVTNCASSEQRRVATSWILKISITLIYIWRTYVVIIVHLVLAWCCRITLFKIELAIISIRHVYKKIIACWK